MNKALNTVIFLNGAAPKKAEMMRLKNDNSYFICADGSFEYVKKIITPDVVIGDFDSLSKNTIFPKTIERVAFPADKDYTDGHLAVEFAYKRGAKNLIIAGADGGKRADHEYNNYSLLALAAELGMNAVLSCGDFFVRLVKGVFKSTVKIGSIISIVPFAADTHILYTKGLKFPAENLYINKLNPSKCVSAISNAAKESDIEICIDNQAALVFVQK